MKSIRQHAIKIVSDLLYSNNRQKATDAIVNLVESYKGYYVLYGSGTYISHPDGIMYTLDIKKATRFQTVVEAQQTLHKINTGLSINTTIKYKIIPVCN